MLELSSLFASAGLKGAEQQLKELAFNGPYQIIRCLQEITKITPY